LVFEQSLLFTYHTRISQAYGWAAERVGAARMSKAFHELHRNKPHRPGYLWGLRKINAAAYVSQLPLLDSGRLWENGDLILPTGDSDKFAEEVRDRLVNNLNERAFVYQNNSNPGTTTNYLSLDLGNAFGAKVRLYTGVESQVQEFQPVKGYMSSVDPRLNFGIGKNTQIDSIHIDWPTGKRTLLTKIAANQVLFPKESEAKARKTEIKTPAPNFTPAVAFTFPYLHQESEFVDFDRDRLRFWSISNEGPRASQADINGDGRMDLVIPGAKGQSTSLWKQGNTGTWSTAQTSLALFLASFHL
jgi:hypothetical protein